MTTTRLILALTLALAAAPRSAPAEDPPTANAPPAKPVVRKVAHSISRMAVSPDGAWVAASDWKGGGAVFSTTGAERRDLPAHDMRRLVFTPDGKFLVTWGEPTEDVEKVTFLGLADRASREIDVTGDKPAGPKSLAPTKLW